MKAWRSARLFIVLASGLLTASKCGADASSSFPDAEVRQWDSIPVEQLDRLWEQAQGSAGVLAIEPYTSVVGSRAAKKKTWAVADDALKFFIYGYEPIWFPADVVRRTACGADTRWSYFWHGFSGDESDLHPWLHGAEGFRDLLGAHGKAALGSGILDAAHCVEVYEGAGPEACLYGEVSPTRGFDTWFCGERGATCRAQVNATHQAAPAGLAAPQELCMHGPFVLERVHGWRPEIHPAELIWARFQADRDAWMFALVPDTSERFDQGEHFEENARRSSEPWRPWSSDRPVELWIAISPDPGTPGIYDLSLKVFGKTGAPARQVALAPPGPGAFGTLSQGLAGVLVASKTWTAGDGKSRGFLVVRTQLRKRAKEALVLRLIGRRAGEAPPDPEIAGVERAAAMAVPEAAALGSVRMFGEARQQRAVVGSVAINTLVRFDPRRPSLPADEELTRTLNEALKGNAKQREAAFGRERPFRVEWDLVAVRDGSGERVPVQMGRATEFAGSPLSDRVRVATFPGPATEEIRVRADGAAPELAAVERKPVSLGQVLLSVPNGVTVTGKGRVFYIGTRPLGFPDPVLEVTMRYPPWSYKDEWDLVSDVLGELDAAAAPQRLAGLRADACAPAPPAECVSEPLAPGVARRLAHPVDRWEALRELESGTRPFARFVFLFARDLRWDGRVSNDERELLKRLLTETSRIPE